MILTIDSQRVMLTTIHTEQSPAERGLIHIEKPSSHSLKGRSDIVIVLRPDIHGPTHSFRIIDECSGIHMAVQFTALSALHTEEMVIVRPAAAAYHQRDITLSRVELLIRSFKRVKIHLHRIFKGKNHITFMS